MYGMAGGMCPARHWFTLPLWCPAGWFSPCGTGYPCRCGVRRGAEPARHLLSLPRGRGPSQTPPSLATDSSISPGPPSPWLPALLIGNRFLSFLRQPRVQSRGCKGLRPLHPRGLLRAALARRASAVPCGGAQGMVVGSPCPPMFPAGACLSPRLPTLLLALFLPPIPPAPFPGGEGGAPKFISPGASPPAPLH